MGKENDVKPGHQEQRKYVIGTVRKQIINAQNAFERQKTKPIKGKNSEKPTS